MNKFELREFGELLHNGWMLKKGLVSNISNPTIDRYYAQAQSEGVIGGKLLGAGNGGFLLLCCSLEKQDAVRKGLSHLKYVEFSIEPEGSKIIYIG